MPTTPPERGILRPARLHRRAGAKTGVRSGKQRLDGGRARGVGERGPSREGHEVLLAAQRRLTRALCPRAYPLVGSVGAQRARLDVVAEHGPEDLGKDALLQRWRFHRESQVDATDEIARHPVARSEKDLLLAAGVEMPDPRVLEESIHHRRDADSLAQIRDRSEER